MKRRPALALIILAALAPGCGGGDSGGSSPSDPFAGYPKGPTREFIVPGGDNAVPEYGREATPVEREQASAVIEKWMRTRAAKDFAAECRYFSRGFIKGFVQGDAERASEGRVKTCPQALDYFGSRASGDFKNTLTGPVDSLRVPDPEPAGDHTNPPGQAVVEQGFAQYHGKGGVDYQIPMNRERGRWWVAAAAPLNREG